MRLSLPDQWAFSRFMSTCLRVLEQHDYLEDMFNELRTEFKTLVPDYGVHLGGDGKYIDSHSTGRIMKRTGKPLDPQADWGVYQRKGIDKKGNALKNITKWFGYKRQSLANSETNLTAFDHLANCWSRA